MFLRKRKKPLPLQTIDAIISRLPASHKKSPLLRKQAAFYQKGYNGERKLDYHLQMLPKEYAILSDVTLRLNGKACQIDSIILTPYAIFMIDVKSFDGNVNFDTTLKQFTRSDGEKLVGYKDPITQIENAQFHLIRWLQNLNLSGLPIYYFISFAEHSTVFTVTGDARSIEKIVAYVDEVPLRIITINEQLKLTNQNNNPLKNNIITRIMNKGEDFQYNVFQTYGIQKSDILTGVQCPSCRTLGMKRFTRYWRCMKCTFCSSNAHIKAIYDYILLFGNKIKNEDCRKFLSISSRGTMRTLLNHAGLTLMNGSKFWILDQSIVNEK